MWCLKRHQIMPHKTFWGTTKKCGNKNLPWFLFRYNFQKCKGREGLGNSSHHVVISAPIDFRFSLMREASFYCTDFDYSPADWTGFRDHFRDAVREHRFNLDVSSTSEFWVQIWNEVQTPHWKSQRHSSAWLSPTSDVVITYKNHFIRLNKHICFVHGQVQTG